MPDEVFHADMKNLGLGHRIHLRLQKNPRCRRRIQLTSAMKYGGTIFPYVRRISLRNENWRGLLLRSLVFNGGGFGGECSRELFDRQNNRLSVRLLSATCLIVLTAGHLTRRGQFCLRKQNSLRVQRIHQA